jgi:FMN-dependent NADH-azoreductase
MAGNSCVRIAIVEDGYIDPAEISAEHTERYMRTVLSFIGVNNPEFVLAEGVTAGEQNKAKAWACALDAVQQLVA